MGYLTNTRDARTIKEIHNAIITLEGWMSSSPELSAMESSCIYVYDALPTRGTEVTFSIVAELGNENTVVLHIPGDNDAQELQAELIFRRELRSAKTIFVFDPDIFRLVQHRMNKDAKCILCSSP